MIGKNVSAAEFFAMIAADDSALTFHNWDRAARGFYISDSHGNRIAYAIQNGNDFEFVIR